MFPKPSFCPLFSLKIIRSIDYYRNIHFSQIFLFQYLFRETVAQLREQWLITGSTKSTLENLSKTLIELIKKNRLFYLNLVPLNTQYEINKKNHQWSCSNKINHLNCPISDVKKRLYGKKKQSGKHITD